LSFAELGETQFKGLSEFSKNISIPCLFRLTIIERSRKAPAFKSYIFKRKAGSGTIKSRQECWRPVRDSNPCASSTLLGQVSSSKGPIRGVIIDGVGGDTCRCAREQRLAKTSQIRISISIPVACCCRRCRNPKRRCCFESRADSSG
jgi:hypothetical protein